MQSRIDSTLKGKGFFGGVTELTGADMVSRRKFQLCGIALEPPASFGARFS
jgi:hypothetical protein